MVLVLGYFAILFAFGGFWFCLLVFCVACCICICVFVFIVAVVHRCGFDFVLIALACGLLFLCFCVCAFCDFVCVVPISGLLICGLLVCCCGLRVLLVVL